MRYTHTHTATTTCACVCVCGHTLRCFLVDGIALVSRRLRLRRCRALKWQKGSCRFTRYLRDGSLSDDEIRFPMYICVFVYICVFIVTFTYTDFSVIMRKINSIASASSLPPRGTVDACRSFGQSSVQ